MMPTLSIARPLVRRHCRARGGPVETDRTPGSQPETGRGRVMIKVHSERRSMASDLQRVIEPLASYICATDQPTIALNLAYSALFNEVAQVTRVAEAHVARFARPVSNKLT